MHTASDDPDDEDYLERTYFMVPNHFLFTTITDGYWEDKLYHFSFLDKKFGALPYDHGPDFVAIEEFIDNSPRSKNARKSKVRRPDEIPEGKWNMRAEEVIYNRVNYIAYKYDDLFAAGKLLHFYDLGSMQRSLMRELVSGR
jgi:hypothetical protein